MPREEKIIGPIWIRFKGDYDYQGIFDLVYEWYRRQKYEIHEKQYKEKAESWRGNEHELKWEGEKKVTEYIKYWVEVHLHSYESKDVEVNGKTIHRGRVEIELNAKVIYDWQKTFEKTPFTKTLGKVYDSVMKREHGMIYEDQLYYQVYELHKRLKEKLGMTITESAYG